MPNTGSKTKVAFLIVALATAASARGAADAFSGPVTPYGKLAASIESAQLEAGIDFDRNNAPKTIPAQPKRGGSWKEWQLRAFGRVPTTDEADSTRAQLDTDTPKWRLGFRASRVLSDLRPPSAGGVATTRWASLQMEYGYGKFEFFPNGVEADRQSSRHHSAAAEATYRELRTPGRGGTQYSPQLRVRYARDWKSADKVGVVFPGAGGAPETVKDLVIAEPDTVPELSARIAVPFTFGSQLGYAPAVMYSTTGGSRDYWPGAKVGRLRGEAFVYWFPSTLKDGGRIGVGAYVDTRVHGDDKRNATEYGALIDLRLGVNLLEY